MQNEKLKLRKKTNYYILLSINIFKRDNAGCTKQLLLEIVNRVNRVNRFGNCSIHTTKCIHDCQYYLIYNSKVKETI